MGILAETASIKNSGSMRLTQYDEIIIQRSDSLIGKLLEKDLSSKRPVDRTPSIIIFTEYCICKIYGIEKFWEEKNNAHARYLLIYLYAKVTNLPGAQIAEKINTYRREVNRSINTINQESDEAQLKKIKYLTQKIQEFYEKI